MTSEKPKRKCFKLIIRFVFLALCHESATECHQIIVTAKGSLGGAVCVFDIIHHSCVRCYANIIDPALHPPSCSFFNPVCPLCPLPSPPMAGGELPSLIIG